MVTSDIFVVRQEMRPGWTCNVILVFGKEKIGIVDTGYENTPEALVFPFIKEQNRRLDEVSMIVNTHRDGDHIRGNLVFKERIRAPIAIHELEMEAVPTADIKLEDKIILGDRDFQVIHTPGHRPGAICLYDEINKILFTGDSVCGTREDLIRMDKNIYINSLRRLMELDVKLMVMSHPFGPLGKDILKDNEIKQMLEASLNIAVSLEQS
jgi:glyoxylase-like metal-dependent hydrolase (beta-lactamase superfamily II)